MKMTPATGSYIMLFSLLLLQFTVVCMANQPTAWPKLIGASPEFAEERIKKDMPSAEFQIVKPGESVTDDFVPWRVRIYVDAPAEKVLRVPRVG